MQNGATLRTRNSGLSRKGLIEIYEHYSPRLYRYAYRLLGDRDQAEECVAETFSRFLKALQEENRKFDNIQAYLYRSAHNWIIDQYRKQEPEALNPEMHADTHTNPATLVTKELERDRVRMALLQLTSEQRQVVLLRFLENLPHEQVAEVIGKSIEATRAIQHRAIAALRIMLSEQEDWHNEL